MIQRKKDVGGRGGPTSQNSVSSTLEDLLQTETKLVPYFIEKCICFIEEEGLSTEGLYRVPGNQVHVVLLIDRFKEGVYHCCIVVLIIITQLTLAAGTCWDLA